MLPAVLIAKKRDGCVLSDEEISWFVESFEDGVVADYQMSAMAMAILLRGMTAEEIASLTEAMLNSGERLQRTAADLPRVDKHSTGGLGDKVSLILAPLLACCGVQVPMISGRGLGLSGGTLDKLEAIAGFSCDLSESQASAVLNDLGCHIIGASKDIAPADRRLYALRDVTGTVESVALITASILSKKLAATLDALVMDVKVGAGAFMKTNAQAVELASSLVSTGSRMNLPVTALITDMDQPLGRSVGNANEVIESIDVLEGRGPADVRELTLALCAEPLVGVGVCKSREDARNLLQEKLDDGSARERFEAMITAQGGSLAKAMPLAKKRPILASRSGTVASIDCLAIGECVVSLGGGRRKQGDIINPSVGVDVDVTIGESVQKGQEVGFVFCDTSDAEPWATRLGTAFELVDADVPTRPLVLDHRGSGYDD